MTKATVKTIGMTLVMTLPIAIMTTIMILI